MLGDNIKNLRYKRKVSAKKLAEYLNVSTSLIYEWEHNRCEPKIKTIINLSKYFNVDIVSLLGIEENYERKGLYSNQTVLKNDNDFNIGNVIRELRLENSLTQNELAENIGSSDKSIWAYENNYSMPPLNIIVRLSNFFNVSTDFLLGVKNGKELFYHLPKKEIDLIRNFRTLESNLQEYVCQIIKFLSKDLNKKI